MIDVELAQRIRRARDEFEAMSPAEQAAHRRAQRISWVYGQLRMSGRDVTIDQVARWIDEHDRRNL